MRQVIVTKYLGPTNHRGARIRVKSEVWSITVPWEYSVDTEANHKAAAAKLIAELGLGDPSEWHGGIMPNGGYVFVHVTERSGVQEMVPRAADQLNRTDLISRLRALNACEEALAWVEQTPGSPEDLWATCRRGDWLLCLLDAVAYDARTMRHIACDIAEGTLHIYEQVYPNDPRPRNCIAVARRYADGEATDDELLAAWREAEEAARATSDIAVDATAKSAMWAVFGDATKTASWAAISNAARAVFVAASAAAWNAAMARHADIVRARVSWTNVEQAMEHTARKGMQEAAT